MNRKKLLYLSITFVMLFILAGCGNSGTQTAVTETVPETDNIDAAQESDGVTADADTIQTDEILEASAEEIPEENSAEEIPEIDETQIEESQTETNTLVVYFSRIGEQYSVGVIEQGNTAIVAEMIAEKTGADVFEITPAEDNYPTDNYDALTDIGLQEQKDNARPAIANEIENFDDYNTIFLGYPIWWGDLPMILYTFLENHDFSGKTIIPFCTHGGSQMAGTAAKITNTVTADAVLNGLAIAGTDAQNNRDRVRETVNSWLADIGY